MTGRPGLHSYGKGIALVRMNTWRDASLLLREAQGFRGKATMCQYMVECLCQRIIAARTRKNSAETRGREFFARLKHANLWFQAASGELTTYLEIFHRSSYDFSFDTRPGDTVFDVGANIGVFSISQAQKLGAGRVYAFEPDPRAYTRLLRNLEANHVNNVISVPKAVWNSAGRAQLQMTDHTTSSTLSSVRQDTVVIDTISLDVFVRTRKIGRIGLLKIDVEGAELEVLRGADALLRRTRQIVLECHSEALRTGVKDFLSSRHFTEVGERQVETGCWILAFKEAESGGAGICSGSCGE